MRLLRLLVTGYVLAAGATVLQAGEEGPAAYSFHEITVEGNGRKTCKLSFVRFDSDQVELKVISNGSDFKRPVYDSLEQALQKNGCVAGTNGGFFDVDPFSAVGFMVLDSKVIAKRPDKPWMHGLILVEAGKLQLGDIDGLFPQVVPQTALQSGPRLLKDGKQEADLHGDSSAWRTFIGRGSGNGNQWILGIASAISLKDLSQVLKSSAVNEVIQLDYALNLDGGSSTGLYVEKEGKALFQRKAPRVQNYIGISPRGSRAASP